MVKSQDYQQNQPNKMKSLSISSNKSTKRKADQKDQQHKEYKMFKSLIITYAEIFLALFDDLWEYVDMNSVLEVCLIYSTIFKFFKKLKVESVFKSLKVSNIKKSLLRVIRNYHFEILLYKDTKKSLIYDIANFRKESVEKIVKLFLKIV